MTRTSTLFISSLCILFISTVALGQVNYVTSWTTGAITIATGGTPLTWTTTVANDEEYSSATNIGFTFTYCGTPFTQFQASTNGFIRMGSGLAAATPADALDGILRSIIAPLWDDLSVSSTTTDITYTLTGTAGSQVLTVSWVNVKWNKSAAAANAEFEVKLYEGSNQIVFRYGTMGIPAATSSASIGLADNTSITTAASAQGKFLSLNVGGIAGTRTYHLSMGLPFNGIAAAPTTGTTITFIPVSPSPLGAGTYPVGGGVNPRGIGFNSLSEAAMALNVNGISGPVTLSLGAGTYDDVFHILNVAGTSATNTITLQPASGTVTISPANGSRTSTAPGITNTDAIIRLDGTQYTTISGLTLSDNANNSASTTLKFDIGICLGTSHLNGVVVAAARNNTIKNCSIDMKSTTGTVHAGSIGIRFGTFNSTEADTAKANSYNTIQDVNITGFWRSAIKYFGTVGTNPDRGNIITGVTGRNTIGNVAVTTGGSSDMRAIEVDVQKDLLIEKTDIVNITNSINTTNSNYGIWFNPASSTTSPNSGTLIVRNCTFSNLSNSGTVATTGLTVAISSNAVANSTELQLYKNTISNIFANGNSTARAEGIFFNLGGTATPSTVKIDNNMISDLRAPRSTSGPAVRGLDLQNAAGGGTFSVFYNSISLNDSTPPTATNHQSACLYFASFASSSLDLRNNILINTMSTNGTGRAIALYASANSNLLRLAPTTDYNNYYIGTGGATRGVSTDVATIYQDLAAHQAAVASGGLGGPRDVNAKSKAVAFVSSANLHLFGASIGDTDLKGIPIATYTTDIDGDTRDGNAPYMGADEGSIALPVQLVSFTGTYQANGVQLNWRTLTEINNYGFEVQRSANSDNGFASLANSFIPGNGTTNIPHNYSYLDNSVQSGTWFYRLKQLDLDGTIHYTEPIQITGVTGVGENVPTAFLLSQNYPNPFNPETRISYTLTKPSAVTLTVYTVTGQEIISLVSEQKSAGRYEVVWNATSASGAKVASGMYFYRIIATPADGSTPFTALKKMMLLK